MSEPTVERFTVFGREGTNCIAVADGHWVRFSDYDTLTEERDRLERDRDFWKEQFQVETRYRIELADKGTLQALTDANIRMEKAEAERDRLALANAELLAGLEPFAKVADQLHPGKYGPAWGFNKAIIEHEDFQKARALLDKYKATSTEREVE